jgi:hypothetical protein
MTTTKGLVARLLAKAEEYERKAAGLRVAAEELTGEQLVAKTNGMPRQLAAATELRVAQKGEAQKGEPADDGLSQSDRSALRRSIVTEYLQAGPRRMSQIAHELQRRGHKISRDRVRQIVNAMPTVVKQTSAHEHPVWALSDGAPAIAGIIERTKQAKRKKVATLGGVRLEKARVIAEILKEAGVALSTAELSDAARARGLSEIIGVHNYAKRGWIKVQKKNGKSRYSFGEMPPATEGSATTNA